MTAIPALLTVFLVLFSSTSSLASSANQIAGSVSYLDGQQAALDLTSDGKTVLLPDEARAKYKDLSLLNPQEDTIIWSDKFPKTNELPDDWAELGLKPDGEEFEFVNFDVANEGRAHILVQKRHPNGHVQVFRLFFDDRGHNILLRKTLLRKIGYRIPAMERLKTVRIKFSGAYSKREFLGSDLEISADASLRTKFFPRPHLDWLVSDPNTNDEYLTFQDLIVVKESTDWYYNLGTGNMVSSVPQGRRLFNSLLVPFAITDLPEDLQNDVSVWTGLEFHNESVIFRYEFREMFRPALADARWMARRILQLKESDWEEIVRSADLPAEPRLLTLELLKSRRNALIEGLRMEKVFKLLPVSYDISSGSGERLKDGKLVGDCKYAGYARRFCSADPDSPMSLANKIGLVKSVGLSNTIQAAVSEFNARIGFSQKRGLAWAVFDRQLDIAAKQFAEFIATGKVTKTPLAFWSKGFYNINVITARDIVTGSYMGSDSHIGSKSNIQLADTIGLSLEGGKYFLGEGLPTRMEAVGRAKGRGVLTWTHLKPLVSITAALEEPLSNIIVPYVKNQGIDPLKALMSLEGETKRFASLTDPREINEARESFNKAVGDHLTKFSESLGIGESYIISFLGGVGVDLNVSKDMLHNLDVYARFRNELIGISRVHIHRKDNDYVHVYFDPVKYNDFGVGMGLKWLIPILDIGYARKDSIGLGGTHFFKFSLNPDLRKNPRFFKEVAAVRAALEGSGRKAMERFQNPWELKHDFGNGRWNFDLLVAKNVTSNTWNTINAISPSGEKSDFVRRAKALRSGIEFQSLLVDVANAIIQEKYAGTSTKLGITNSGNPGDTIYGSSVTRESKAEARVEKGPIDFGNVFSAINYRWKGWEVGRSGLNDIFNQIDKLFGQPMFQRENLGSTKKTQLYTLEVQVALSRTAIEAIVSSDDAKIHQIFKMYPRELPPGEAGDVREHPWAIWMIGDLKHLRGALKAGDYRGFVDRLAAIVETAEAQLEFEGFKALVGGPENIYVQGYLSGFRTNSKTGDKEIRLKPIGQIGTSEPRGPIATLQGEMGITGGELLLFWLVNPL